MRAVALRREDEQRTTVHTAHRNSTWGRTRLSRRPQRGCHYEESKHGEREPRWHELPNRSTTSGGGFRMEGDVMPSCEKAERHFT